MLQPLSHCAPQIAWPGAAFGLQTRSALTAMSNLECPVSEKPLAGWKTWWGPELPTKIAKSMMEQLDAKSLPGKGGLLHFQDPCRVSAADLHGQGDHVAHISSIAEALLLAYPLDKQPSSYLLGDAVLHLNFLFGYSLIGKPVSNPIKEESRRKLALVEGGKLRMLLSYIRTRANKAENAKNDGVSYLKSLANRRKPFIKSPSTSSTSTVHLSDMMSPASIPSSEAECLGSQSMFCLPETFSEPLSASNRFKSV